MPELTPQTFAALWTMAKRDEVPDDAEHARLQKFMKLHGDMHDAWEAFEQDPAEPPVRDGENLMLHILMDATVEKALEWGQPPGIREMMQGMLDRGVEPTAAFHVLSHAMQHEYLHAAAQGQPMDQDQFMARAERYAREALDEGGAGD